MHDLPIVGVPLLAILAGILLNRADVKELRAHTDQQIASLRTEMKDLRNETKELGNETAAHFNRIDQRFDRIDTDLRQFFHVTGKLEGRIDSLEKR